MRPVKLSLAEYIVQIHSHRSRILRVSNFVWGKNSLESKIIGIHDLEKWILLPGMVYFYYFSNPTVARKFYDFLNLFGSYISSAYRFFCMPNLSENQLADLLDKEKALDILDRHLDPIAFREFGITSKKPLESFLNPKQIVIAQHILDTYPWLKLEGISLN